MNSNRQIITIRTVICAAGILAGTFLRLFYLGVFPLDNTEATLALQAYQVSSSSTGAAFGGNPLYLVLTTGLFQLFGSSNFLARLIPALAGIAILFLPFANRKQSKCRLDGLDDLVTGN